MYDSTVIKIALLALLTSLFFSFALYPMFSSSMRAGPDPDRFGELGLSIAEGNGFAYSRGGEPVLERTPLYSYIVAGLFVLGGGFSLTAVQIYQAIVHAATSALLFVAIARLFQRRTALVSQIIFAFHPIAVWYTARIWVETTHTFLLVLVAYFVILLFENPSLRRATISGLVIGLSCLTKPILLSFPIVLAGLLLLRFGTKALRPGTAVIITAAIAILPWTFRNYQVSEQFVPVTTSLGFNLVQGNVIGDLWPDGRMGILEYWHEGNRRGEEILSVHDVPWQSVKGDSLLTRAGIQKLTDSPLYAVKRLAANFCTFWYLSESATKSIFIGMLQVPLLIGSLISVIRLDGKRRRYLMPVIALATYYVLVHAGIVGWGRYSMPMIPILLILAAPLCEGIEFRWGKKE